MLNRSPLPLALIIMDGLGNNPNPRGNAVAAAKTPTLDRLRKECPMTELITSGTRVGLPEGQMGNSEVGHLNIGGGRIVQQDLTRIDLAVCERRIGTEPSFQALCRKALATPGAVFHLVGLVSRGGVHSSLEHLKGLIDAALELHVERLFIHVITDGRDRPPTSSPEEVGELLEFITERRRQTGALIAIPSVIGRYFAMDRDTRWERTKRAYDLFVHGVGQPFDDPIAALRHSLGRGTTDEFHQPVVISINDTLGRIRDDDVLLFFNFRADRMRQIVTAFLSEDENFPYFDRGRRLRLGAIGTLTEYEPHYPVTVIFRPVKVTNHFGAVISAAGLRQLRTAETEKYPHVTYFFNGGVEEAFPGEERILVPSPRDVPTYDQKPEMSAFAVTDALRARLEKGDIEVVVVNFANCDMVGHTGVFEAAVTAVETVDLCVGRVLESIERLGGCAIVTSDHGNAEQMIDYETGLPHTFHTTFPVPFFIVGSEFRKRTLRTGGALCDIAPTALEMIRLSQPPEMTGQSLFSDGGRRSEVTLDGGNKTRASR